MATVNGLTETSRVGEPAWEVARLFPVQGAWTEAEYFALETNRLVELVDGRLEVLPLPTLQHQDIVAYLYLLVREFLEKWGKGGRVYFAPVPVRLRARSIREPDLFYIAAEHLGDLKKAPERIDLAMEVVSAGESNRDRDYLQKRADYAEAGVREYWIVDPEERKITVLTLEESSYREHGVFGPGETASSVLLPGFEVSVNGYLEAGNGNPGVKGS